MYNGYNIYFILRFGLVNTINTSFCAGGNFSLQCVFIKFPKLNLKIFITINGEYNNWMFWREKKKTESLIKNIS